MTPYPPAQKLLLAAAVAWTALIVFAPALHLGGF